MSILASLWSSLQGYIYLTIRPWRSIGAPETTAAATDSPGSLPSSTRRGTGEKVLYQELVVRRLETVTTRLTRSGNPQLHHNLKDALAASQHRPAASQGPARLPKPVPVE